VEIRPLSIEGAWVITPVQHSDPRGVFMELYRFDKLAEAVGHPLNLAQSNLSVSAKGVVRGIHYADVPPGQAKYVTCPQGVGLDVIVDLRVGSPTFGRYETVLLDGVDRRAVYIAEGLGHAFCALTDATTLLYLCSTTYNPQREHGVHPLDPELGIEWPVTDPILSAKDAAAPSLATALERGLLPDMDTCRKYYAELNGAFPGA